MLAVRKIITDVLDSELRIGVQQFPADAYCKGVRHIYVAHSSVAAIYFRNGGEKFAAVVVATTALSCRNFFY